MKQRFKGFLALVLMLALLASLALASTAEETKKAYDFEQDDYSERPALESGTTVVYPGDEIYTSQLSGGKIFCITDKKEGGAPLNTGSGDYYNSAIADKNGDFVDGITALCGGGHYVVPALETGYKAYTTHIGVFQNYFTPGYSPDDDPDVQEYYKLSSLYLEPIPIVYTVSFDANGGTGTVENMTLSYGEEKALPENALTREGYTFAGWNTKADGSGTAFADKATVKNLTVSETEAFLLFAQWTEIVSSDTENENPSNTTDNGTPSDSDIVDSDVTDSAVSDTSASDVSDVTDSDVTDTENSEVTTDSVTDAVSDLSSETSGTSSDKTTDSTANGTGSGNGEVEEDSSVLWIILVVALLVAAAVVGAYIYFRKKKPEVNE